MEKIKPILISIDFRGDKGGIARVANLMYKSLPFDRVVSLHGKGTVGNIFFYNGRRLSFLINVLYLLIVKRPGLIVFDHLNIARLLVFLPNYFLKKVVLFVYDEEVWKKVVGLHRIALNKTTDILCISDHSMQKFLSCNPEFKNKTKLCLLAGVPQTFLDVEEEVQRDYSDWINDPRPYGIFVSRLWKAHRYKGHFELLDAFKKHYEYSENASLRLAIVGNGDDASAVENFIKNNHLQGIVRLFSGLSDTDLVQFYKKSSVLIFPSTREGFGFVFVEAMFFKKACIGITNQPAEEIIIQGSTGELLPDNHPETLRKILLDIEENPVKYNKYGEAGYRRYEEHFTNEHFKTRFLKAILFKNNDKLNSAISRKINDNL